MSKKTGGGNVDDFLDSISPSPDILGGHMVYTHKSLRITSKNTMGENWALDYFELTHQKKLLSIQENVLLVYPGHFVAGVNKKVHSLRHFLEIDFYP